MLCGPSSGINVAAAHKVAKAHPELRRIVTVIPDTGQRYLSGELFGERAKWRSPSASTPSTPTPWRCWPSTATASSSSPESLSRVAAGNGGLNRGSTHAVCCARRRPEVPSP